MRTSLATTEDPRIRLANLALRAAPWVAVIVFMMWGWGWRDLTATLPHYGDTMETVVGTVWLDESISEGKSPLVIDSSCRTVMSSFPLHPNSGQ